MNEKLLDALACAIYVSRLAASGGTVDDDDKRLRVSGLYPDWTPARHQVGELYNTRAENGLDVEQTWECTQEYDPDTCPDVKPGNPAWYTCHRPLHGRTPETARPFVPVQGEQDGYRAGEYMTLDGGTYRCRRDTALSPLESSGDWEEAPA